LYRDECLQRHDTGLLVEACLHPACPFRDRSATSSAQQVRGFTQALLRTVKPPSKDFPRDPIAIPDAAEAIMCKRRTT
jgi:hypothetical protein